MLKWPRAICCCSVHWVSRLKHKKKGGYIKNQSNSVLCKKGIIFSSQSLFEGKTHLTSVIFIAWAQLCPAVIHVVNAYLIYHSLSSTQTIYEYGFAFFFSSLLGTYHLFFQRDTWCNVCRIHAESGTASF